MTSIRPTEILEIFLSYSLAVVSIHFTKCFQIRLDFVSFIITGPQTVTTSVGKTANVLFFGAAKNAINFTGKCLTDVFTVGGGPGVPPLCGTLTGTVMEI